MDFHLTEDQRSVADLASSILTDRATTDRVREIEVTPTRVDDDLWRDLGRAGLLGLALPEADGGAGLGLAGLVVVLEEYGTRAPRDPACSASSAGGAWTLTGTKAAVPSYLGADHVLVSAAGPDGPALFVLPREGAGISWNRTETTSHDAAGELVLDAAPARLVGDAAALTSILRVSAVALAALQLGVAQGALKLAATYTSGREQFGRPLATFQSLQHQLADCLIDIDAMRVTTWQAVQELEEDGVAVDRAVEVASWWRAQAGLDVVHRVQHVHGGIGVDVDYPVHRFFLWGRQLAGTLGGAGAVLAELGARLRVEEVHS